MHAQPGSYIIVCFTQSQQVGSRFARKRNDWPLHLTLVPWFVGVSADALMAILQRIADATSPFVLRVGRDASFGEQADIPVSRIEDQAPIERLHRDLWSQLYNAGMRCVSSRYTDARYQAHITHHADARFYPGDELNINDYYLVELQAGNMCLVRERYSLGGAR